MLPWYSPRLAKATRVGSLGRREKELRRTQVQAEEVLLRFSRNQLG